MKVNICGLYVNDTTYKQVIDQVLEHIEKKSNSVLSVFSCNVDMVVKAHRDKLFKAIMNRGDILIPDGMPIVWLGRRLGGVFKERVTGADLVPMLIQEASERKFTVSFLGAAEGVAAKAAENFQQRFGSFNIGSIISPPLNFEKDPKELEKIFNKLQETRSEILFIALGAPKQEKFILDYQNRLNSSVILGIGGSLDMAAGKVKRAPVWMQRVGAEWVWRLIEEPGRMFKRYIIEDSIFVFLALKALFNKGKHEGIE